MSRVIYICLSLFLIAAPFSAAMAEVEVVDVGAEALEKLNDSRTKRGREPITVNEQLTRAAAAHASDMASKRFFSHVGSDGSAVEERVRAAGYSFCLVAENIAKGQPNLKKALRSWLGSKGHRRNILQSQATEFGLVRGEGDIWVLVLAQPGC